jgi:hypothetical protein
VVTNKLSTQGLEGEGHVADVPPMDARPVYEIDTAVAAPAFLVDLTEFACGEETMETALAIRIGTLDLERFEFGGSIRLSLH